MKYTRLDHAVTIEFTPQEYMRFLYLLGYLMGKLEDNRDMRELLLFIDEMNVGNDNYEPYTEEFRRRAGDKEAHDK